MKKNDEWDFYTFRERLKWRIGLHWWKIALVENCIGSASGIIVGDFDMSVSRYERVLVGNSNGSLVYICFALVIAPWAISDK